MGRLQGVTNVGPLVCHAFMGLSWVGQLPPFHFYFYTGNDKTPEIPL